MGETKYGIGQRVRSIYSPSYYRVESILVTDRINPDENVYSLISDTGEHTTAEEGELISLAEFYGMN